MAKKKQTKKQNNTLFRIAVIGMSILSGYTTAMGAIPLFGFILSIGLAVVLSILLVALALRLPDAYEANQHRPIIWGYFAVAMISILFNFNYLYGKFAAEDLLYSELNEKKELLDDMRINAKNSKDKELKIVSLSKRIEELKTKIEYELKNHPDPTERGAGSRWRGAVDEKEKLDIEYAGKIKTHQVFYDKIEEAAIAVDEINIAQQSQDLVQYRSAIENSVDKYNELSKEIRGGSSFEPHPKSVKFIHKDIGKLDHSIWTLFNFFRFSGRQISSIFVALSISAMIDLVVLFVIAVVSRPDVPLRRGKENSKRKPMPPPEEESIYVERS